MEGCWQSWRYKLKGILGFKVGMTQLIDDDGVVTPVTIIQAGPCYITQVKTNETDGYKAVQVGFGDVKEASLTRGQKGHLGILNGDAKNGGLSAVRYLREFSTDSIDGYEVGQTLTADQFEIGDMVDVTGKSKGKGFAGTVKRHGFAGGPKTHGQSDRWRAPGSIGATSSTARVFKGTRMSGRMGGENKTIQNVKVVQVDVERNLIAVKGPVPGAKGGLIVIKDAVKG